MTASTSPDRSTSDDALASGGPAGDGGFDPTKPFATRDGRLVERFAKNTIYFYGYVEDNLRNWCLATGRHGVYCYPDPALDLINTPTPTAPPTPAGDMAREDDAAFVERMKPCDYEQVSPEEFVRLIALAREGARRDLKGAASE